MSKFEPSIPEVVLNGAITIQLGNRILKYDIIFSHFFFVNDPSLLNLSISSREPNIYLIIFSNSNFILVCYASTMRPMLDSLDLVVEEADILLHEDDAELLGGRVDSGVILTATGCRNILGT